MTERKRNPKEPTPLVLMNPELRVRQLRFAANIEASQMVPLHRYYEVLLDLSAMGLEYLKAIKLERAFIIFKRIEYFVFHRLKEFPGVQSFSSEAKNKILGRLPMLMFVAQQIIVEFIMPVYERQAAYFRYEELQRRLKILNPAAWNAIMPEAMKRQAQFYEEAEKISTRFGVELSSFLPIEVTPDDNHPSNYPPRTHLAKPNTTANQRAEDLAENTALSLAIQTMNNSVGTLTSNQPIDQLVQNVNDMMNNALLNFFTARQAHAASSRYPNANFPGVNVPEPNPNQLAEVNHQPLGEINLSPTGEEVANAGTRSYSPSVTHMYRVPTDYSTDSEGQKPEGKSRYEYNPTPISAYISLLNLTFDANSTKATGFRVQQKKTNGPSASTAGFLLELVRDNGTLVDVAALGLILPDTDPGPPRGTPPTEPVENAEPPSDKWGVWAKRGAAAVNPEGLGSLAVISDLDRAREELDKVPPMPENLGIVRSSNSDEIDVVTVSDDKEKESQPRRKRQSNVGLGGDVKRPNN